MISSAEAARRISGAPAPALVLDTCALLDLTRDLTREGFCPGQIEAAKRLLILAESRPRRLWLPIVEQILSERSDNQVKVRDEATSKIQKFERRVQEMQA